MVSSEDAIEVKKLEDDEEDCKFFSSRMASRNRMRKERTIAPGSSFRVCYAVVGVPFLWESKPGTPELGAPAQVGACTAALPPLTPPPSYYTGNSKGRRLSSSKSSSLFKSLLPKLARRRSRRPSSSSSSSSFRDRLTLCFRL